MQYDFTKIQRAIHLSGKTQQEVEALSGVNRKTLSRALRSGRASQKTALRLTNAFALSMADVVLPLKPKRKTA